MIRNIHSRLLRYFFAIIGLFLVNITLADTAYQGQWYQIELVIFSHLNTYGLDSEQWPLLQYSQPVWQGASELNSNQLLPKQDYLLERETQALKHQYGYHVLLHLSWRQQVFGPNATQAIHIYGGDLYNSAGQKINANPDNTNAMNNNAAGNWQVNGIISVSVERYFNVHFNLFFAEPVLRLIEISKNNYFNQLGSGLAYFHLMQTRRMRSDQLNYIDYPIYGVLIKIMPIKANS